MRRIGDKEIALAKHPNLAYASVSDYSVWVEEKDREIAQAQLEVCEKEAEEKITKANQLGFQAGKDARVREIFEEIEASEYSWPIEDLLEVLKKKYLEE